MGQLQFPPAGLSWNERPGRTGRVLRQRDSLTNQLMMRRLAARRVGIGTVAREQQSLTATATEVLFLLVAAAAGLGHPGIAAIEIEHRRVVPDLLQALLAHVGKGDVLEVAGLRAGQHVAVGRDGHVNGAPTIHAGLGAAFVVVRDDEKMVSRSPKRSRAACTWPSARCSSACVGIKASRLSRAQL